MKPVLIKDLFSSEDLVELHRIINLKEHTLDEPDMGRTLHNLDSLQKSYLGKKVIKMVSDIVGKNLKMTSEGYAVYKKELGIPSLSPHVDGSFTEYILDYQVDSNIEWPIIVEEEPVFLKDNEAVLFSSKYDFHWRPKKEFNDKDFISMIFFHFVDVDNPDAAGQINLSDGDKIKFEKYISLWENGQ
jgi:hypothetical protein